MGREGLKSGAVSSGKSQSMTWLLTFSAMSLPLPSRRPQSQAESDQKPSQGPVLPLSPSGPPTGKVAPHPGPHSPASLAILGSESGKLSWNLSATTQPGLDVSEVVSWVHRAITRTLGPNELRHSELSRL